MGGGFSNNNKVVSAYFLTISSKKIRNYRGDLFFRPFQLGGQWNFKKKKKKNTGFFYDYLTMRKKINLEPDKKHFVFLTSFNH